MPPSRKTHRFLTHGRNRDTKPVVAKQMTDANSLLTQDSQYALRKLHPPGFASRRGRSVTGRWTSLSGNRNKRCSLRLTSQSVESTQEWEPMDEHAGNRRSSGGSNRKESVNGRGRGRRRIRHGERGPDKSRTNAGRRIRHLRHQQLSGPYKAHPRTGGSLEIQASNAPTLNPGKALKYAPDKGNTSSTGNSRRSETSEDQHVRKAETRRFPYDDGDPEGPDAVTARLKRGQRSAPRVHRAPHDPRSDRSRGILDAFLNTCDRWRLEEGDRAVLLGVSRSRSLAQTVLADYDALATRDTEYRAGFVVGISIGLGVLFGDDEESECIWLNSPRPQLGDMTPLGYMLEGSMIALLAVSERVRRERGL